MNQMLVVQKRGRFYRQAVEGKIFSWGKTQTALSANSISLTSTTTPIIGVWNSSTASTTAGRNLAILQVTCIQSVAGNSAVAPGAFVYAVSTGNASISTGNTPWRHSDLTQAGSVAKGFDLATALTGITNNLVIIGGASFGPLVAAQGGTASPLFSPQGQENLDGQIIVPPGGVFALLNVTSTTTVSVAARIVWEEVPLDKI